MKAHEFVTIAAANTYRINLNGEILNSKGYPVKANDNGVVKLTDNEGKRKDFKVSDLVAAIKTGNAVEAVKAVEQPDIPDFLKEAAPAQAPVAEEPEAAADQAHEIVLAVSPEAAKEMQAAAPAPVKQKRQSKTKAAAETSEGVEPEASPSPEKKKRRAITLADVADIKAKFAAGAKRKDLAAEYGIDYSYVAHLINGGIVPAK